MDDHGQKSMDDVERVADDHNGDSDDDERAAEACRHPVKALRDGEGRHADGKQPDITHDVTERGNGVRKAVNALPNPAFQALSKGFVRRHSSEQHDEQDPAPIAQAMAARLTDSPMTRISTIKYSAQMDSSQPTSAIQPRSFPQILRRMFMTHASASCMTPMEKQNFITLFCAAVEDTSKYSG